MEETIREEISSIVASAHLSSEEKASIVASYDWPKDNKITSSPNESKADQDIEVKMKKDGDDKLNDDGKSEKDDESMLRPLSQHEKVHHATETKPREGNNNLPSDGISKETNDQSSSQAAKTKEVIDILTAEEISLILASDLSPEEKSSLLTANLTEDQIKTCNTPSRVELEEKVHHATETKPREDNNNLPSDGISKETNDQSSSQAAKAKVALDQKLTMSNEKPSLSACNRNEEDNVTSAEVKTSTNSSKVEHEEKNKHMGTEANPEHEPITRHEDGSVKLINKHSLLRAQQDPAEHRHLLQELRLEQAIVIAREIKEPQDNSVGEGVQTIYKEEAVCKKCCKYVFHEEIVLWAKCKCKLALIHEQCAIEWSNEKGSTCLACGEEIKNVYVTLTMDASSSSSPPQSTEDQLDTPTSVSKKRFWCF